MSESGQEFEFFVYRLEQLGQHRGATGAAVLRELDESGITSLVYQLYGQYHAERIENAFDDVAELLRSRRESLAAGSG
ncbi:MAG: DUF3791 domain-containing protein [Propionibacteriaceae bacterium]|jgi:hypothetical protein|nr:DUF3791 domain-containing protein [Propionibacteriaceae bacterium]